MSDPKRRKQQRFQVDTAREKPKQRAIVIVPVISASALAGQRDSDDTNTLFRRSESARLEEACGLARAIDLDVVHQGAVVLTKLKSATLFGTGKADELAGIIEGSDAGLVIVDHPLTPVQQRNLEKAWNAKVLDRTGLILEIFGARAQTKEGRLQVELAHLNYQRGRLVRSWTHLERQRGGGGGSGGFLGGPGETQIESDRRQLQDRVNRLEKELEKVRRTRSLHRSKRKKVPHPIVALVGYTNAGKSTLFNSITGADVMAKDMLFATLDPTLRRLNLPEGTPVILSDTVGFVSALPTHLVAAFRATLEEVIEADLILHVRDIADPDSAAQAADVYAILDQLGIASAGHESVVEIWNKIDLLEEERRAVLQDRAEVQGALLVSAQSGEGLPALERLMEARIGAEHREMDVHLTASEMRHIGWIYENSFVSDRTEHDDGGVTLHIKLPEKLLSELEGRLAA